MPQLTATRLTQSRWGVGGGPPLFSFSPVLPSRKMEKPCHLCKARESHKLVHSKKTKRHGKDPCFLSRLLGPLSRSEFLWAGRKGRHLELWVCVLAQESLPSYRNIPLRSNPRNNPNCMYHNTNVGLPQRVMWFLI